MLEHPVENIFAGKQQQKKEQQIVWQILRFRGNYLVRHSHLRRNIKEGKEGNKQEVTALDIVVALITIIIVSNSRQLLPGRNLENQLQRQLSYSPERRENKNFIIYFTAISLQKIYIHLKIHI